MLVVEIFYILTAFVLRFPEHIYFHFFVPEGEDEKLTYYKLKVILPLANIEIIGYAQVTCSISNLLFIIRNSFGFV